ncbi:MAG: sensor histidine kinase [Methylococcaceae bacterium]|nr:sensor histidine kinase [Methylococcaceae bacterium]
MNLQLHLLSRIAVLALLCLLAIASYALFQSHHQSEQSTRQMAESLGKQLESQLLLIDAGMGLVNPFPDFELWKQSGAQPGICLAYAPAGDGNSRRLCTGSKPIAADWPASFEKTYRRIFDPGLQAVRPITSKGRVHGSLTVTPSAELEIADAWNKTLDLMTLSSVTVSAVCLLVYLSISRALRPAQTIVSGVEDLESGHLDFRLPSFELKEWQRIASAINQLAASQQQLLDERQKLAVKLIDLQEQERRYLATELHDEFGQCLAAINALASSIKQTAEQRSPDLVAEADHIGRITTHMLEGVRCLLARLRPAEFDELGLAASLNSLVAGWNGRSSGKTRYHLSIVGDCAVLTETQALALFRIAQECLTNIAKHASASAVGVTLTIDDEAAVLTVKDDGVARQLPFADVAGIGLLGIRERVNALHGQLKLAIAEPSGLIVEARLPLAATTEASA